MHPKWGRQLAIIAVLVLVLALAAPTRASAQELDFDAAVALLSSGTEDEVRMGIETLGVLGNAAAVGPLSTRIRRGLPPALLEAAVDTLGLLGRAEAGPVLFELTAHRRPEIRLRAVQAIATCTPRGADRALISSLSDSSPAVRSAAASALGDLRAVSAMESLFLAFDHDVIEAGITIARIARPEDVRRLLGYLEQRPFAHLRAPIMQLLSRADLPQRVRLDVIARLGELATGEVRTMMEEFLQAYQAPPNDPIRRAAEDVMTRIAQ